MDLFFIVNPALEGVTGLMAGSYKELWLGLCAWPKL